MRTALEAFDAAIEAARGMYSSSGGDDVAADRLIAECRQRIEVQTAALETCEDELASVSKAQRDTFTVSDQFAARLFPEATLDANLSEVLVGRKMPPFPRRPDEDEVRAAMDFQNEASARLAYARADAMMKIRGEK